MHFNSLHDSLLQQAFYVQMAQFFFFYILTTCTIPFDGLWEYPGFLLDSSHEFSVFCFYFFLTWQLNMFPRYYR